MNTKAQEPIVEPERLTVVQILNAMKVKHVVGVITAVSGIATGSFLLGYRIRSGLYEQKEAALSADVQSWQAKCESIRKRNEMFEAMFEIQAMVVDYRAKYPEGFNDDSDEVYDLDAWRRFNLFVIEKFQRWGTDFADITGILAGKKSFAEIIHGQNSGIIRFPFAGKRIEVPRGLWLATLEGEEASPF